MPRQLCIEKATGDADEAVEREHQTHSVEFVDADAPEQVGHRGTQCAGRSGERADEAVAGEGPGPLAVVDDSGQHRVLDRHKGAGAAAGRIDCAYEGDDQQHGVDVRAGQDEAGRRHQRRSRDEQTAVFDPSPDQPDGERQQCRAEECHAGENADS